MLEFIRSSSILAFHLGDDQILFDMKGLRGSRSCVGGCLGGYAGCFRSLLHHDEGVTPVATASIISMPSQSGEAIVERGSGESRQDPSEGR